MTTVIFDSSGLEAQIAQSCLKDTCALVKMSPSQFRKAWRALPGHTQAAIKAIALESSMVEIQNALAMYMQIVGAAGEELERSQVYPAYQLLQMAAIVRVLGDAVGSCARIE